MNDLYNKFRELSIVDKFQPFNSHIEAFIKLVDPNRFKDSLENVQFDLAGSSNYEDLIKRVKQLYSDYDGDVLM